MSKDDSSGSSSGTREVGTPDGAASVRPASSGAAPAGTLGDRVDRTPLLIWAGLSLVSVLVRSLTLGEGWALERWDVLAQWDSYTILSLAEGSEVDGSFAMPGYALLIRGTQWVTGDQLTTAVLITYAASGVSSYLLWQWLAERGHDPEIRFWAVSALLVFPYSFVLYGVIGPDALGLALLLATFVLLDKNRHVLAGLAAALSITVMATALAVLPALMVFVWRTRRRSEDSGSSDPVAGAGNDRGGPLMALLMALLGPVALTVFSAWEHGNAWLAWTGDGMFGGLRAGVLRLATWVRVGWLLGDDPMSWTLNRTAQSLLMVVFVLLAYRVWRRFGPEMAVLVIGVVVLTLVAYPDVSSSGRHLTAAFPIAGLAGLALGRLPRPAAGTVVAASSVLMFMFYVFYLDSTGFPFW